MSQIRNILSKCQVPIDDIRTNVPTCDKTNPSASSLTSPFYTALGALLMPVLIAGLLWMMNTKTLDKPYRNGIIMNSALVLGLAINELL